MKMVSLKQYPKDKKNRPDEVAAISPGEVNEPLYPWGTSIRLEDEQMDKLGDAADLDMDRQIIIKAKGYIKTKMTDEVSGKDREGGEGRRRRSMEIQITDIAIMADDDFEAAYDSDERSGDDEGW